MQRLWQASTSQTQSFHDAFPITRTDIVFIGDSHVQDFRWEDFVQSKFLGRMKARNLGIANETTAELVRRLPFILTHQPRLIILQTGGSDIRQGYQSKATLAKYKKLIHMIHQASPQSQLIVQGILPQGRLQAKRIQSLNRSIAQLAEAGGDRFIDLFPLLSNDDGALKVDYSQDDYMLLGPGYERWCEVIAAQIKNLL